MAKDNHKLITLFLGLFYSLFFSVVIAFIIYLFLEKKYFVGPIFLVSSFVVLLPLFFRKDRKKIIQLLKSELVFGFIDNGFLAVTALIGAEFFGILGAVIGALLGNALTDGLAGAFEGHYAHNSYGRDALVSALGKLSGCLFGGGLILLLVWTLF